jgi:hypothetical protein
MMNSFVPLKIVSSFVLECIMLFGNGLPFGFIICDF